ncbi:MAG: HNH endonuclease [Planctomycetaceae bacterium]|nr:HNH endonuclease [Planctomycetaceae bacterium]
MSNSESFRTVKALVMDWVHRCEGDVDYDALTREVARHFPDSKWKKTHWAWYKNQIMNGRFRSQFSQDELRALGLAKGKSKAPAMPPQTTAEATGAPLVRGPQARDADVKKFGDALLNHVRLVISLAAGEDIDKRFKLNRWVLSRLLQDEIRVKRPIKKKLWDMGMQSCKACGEPFESIKGVEIHRKNGAVAYSVENCELLCRECHQELY